MTFTNMCSTLRAKNSKQVSYEQETVGPSYPIVTSEWA